MKTLVATMTVLLSCTAAMAQDLTCSRVGNSTYCNGTDGSSYTGNRVGNTTYWHKNGDIPKVDDEDDEDDEDDADTSIPLSGKPVDIGASLRKDLI